MKGTLYYWLHMVEPCLSGIMDAGQYGSIFPLSRPVCFNTPSRHTPSESSLLFQLRSIAGIILRPLENNII